MIHPESPAFNECHIYHWRSTEKGDDGKPYEADNVIPRWHGGLTKREYFVGQALRGVCEWDAILNQHSPEHAGQVASIAQSCVALADAVIEALNDDGPEDAA